MAKTFKKIETVREISMYCIKCSVKVKYFMTNKEIFNKTTIQQHCKNCKEITKYVPC